MTYICRGCPRQCGIDRHKTTGYCKVGNLKVALVQLHHWEEPVISGCQGSGTIFFSGCNLRCCYCQNWQVSNAEVGIEITPNRLAEIFKN